MKSPVTSQTIGRVPVPRTVTPRGIVTLRNWKTPPTTLIGGAPFGVICVKSVLRTISRVCGS